jgi:hypothetical protein
MTTGFRQSRPVPDAAIAAVLCAFAMIAGVLYCRAFERTRAPAEPWVRELGAAVAFACGHGYVDPGYEPSPAVAAFLEKRVDRISCADLPAGAPRQPPNFTQALYKYMTLSIGLVWRLFGVSWTSVSLLLGLLYAVSAAAVYGIFRLALSRVAAVAGTLIMTMSPLELRFLPQLRDYAKTPFILTLIFILGLLVVRPFSRRRLLTLAAAYGAVMGIGFGFRNDLLINVLPFVVTVAMFLPVPMRSHVRLKLAALMLAAACFVVCAWPIITAYRSGSNTGHVALLGLMTSFNGPLGVTASVYDWGAPYDDGFVMKVVGSFADRVHHRPVVVLSSDYERAAADYLLTIVRHWPADVVIRGYASVLRVLELPFQVRAYTTAVPPAIVGGNIGRLYAVWDAVVSRLSGIGVPIAALAVVASAGASVRVATWLLGALLYFAGYPAVQFDARHFFFLEFIPWLALAMVAEGAWRLLRALRQKRAGLAPAPIVADRGRRVLAFAISAMLALGGSVVALRAYQQRHVASLLESYLEMPAEELTLSRTQVGDRLVLVRPDQLSQSTEPRVRAEYLAVDIRQHNCDRLLAPVTIRYATLSGYTDLSERVYVPVPRVDAPFHLFFPVYYSPGSYFAGLELSAADSACIAAMRRIRDLDRTPILLNLTLPPDWEQMKLYQTLTNWERPSAPYRVRVYAWPRMLDPARLDLRRVTLPALAPLSHSRIVATDAADRWVVRGFARGSTTFLVRLPEHPVAKGVCFVARGTLYRGGFTLGLLQNQLWATTVNVTAPGEFLAVVEAPDDGAYVPALANFLMGLNRRNDFVVTAAGWANSSDAPSVQVLNRRRP